MAKELEYTFRLPSSLLHHSHPFTQSLTAEYVSVVVHLCRGCRSVITCCYRTPSCSVADFTTDLSVLTASLYLLSDDVSILGDINIDLNNSNTPQDVTDRTSSTSESC